jgi:hypothetical protein
LGPVNPTKSVSNAIGPQQISARVHARHDSNTMTGELVD